MMASAAGATGWERLEIECANCKIFGWEQPDLRARSLRRCTGCQKMFYCSKDCQEDCQDCQEEHWRKVHKGHCKFFSGEKVLEGGLGHNKETCSICFLQDAAGQAVFKEGNPNYICLFDPINPRAKSLLEVQLHYPLPSAESRQNRVEKIIDILQRLLLKIRVTKQPVFRLYPRELESVANELCHLKMKVFSESATSPRNLQIPVDLTHLKTLLSKDLTNLPPSGRFQMWQTFLMLFDMLFCLRTIEVDRMIKNPQKSLPKDQRQMSQFVRKGSYIRVLDQILEVLELRVVSQKDLAAIVCEGNMQQVCSACKKNTTVAVISTCGVKIAGEPAVMFQSGQNNLFSCGAKTCEDQMGVNPKVFSWHLAVWATSNNLRATRCDFCFLLAPVKEVHRFF